MSTDSASFTRQSFKWVKSDSGSTYLCPVDAVRGLDNPSEEQLRSRCVDESLNPQND
ncbi:MAG: hypothetical protein ACYTG0_04370 [Planctomycetota bacterium]|jgi:hypothetical protein